MLGLPRLEGLCPFSFFTSQGSVEHRSGMNELGSSKDSSTTLVIGPIYEIAETYKNALLTALGGLLAENVVAT